MKGFTASLVWLVVQAVIKRVDGAVDCAPSTKSFTIKTAQDVSDITKCTTFSGSITVAADGPEAIQLDGLQKINGSLELKGVTNLRSLSSTTLSSVETFSLQELPELSTLSIPSLKTFKALRWAKLPGLQNCTVATSAIEGEISEIAIYNTSLESLDWLIWPVGSLNITSNSNLTTFKIPYTSINANSALTIVSNPSLANVDLSLLTGIYGALDISGNNVETLNFTKLESIGGFVQLNGDYTNISMPVLTGINGALSVESTDDIGSFCDSLAQKKLHAHYDCTSNVRVPVGSNTTSTTETTQAPTLSPETPNTSNKDDGKEKYAIAGVLGGLTISSIIAAIFYFRRRSRRNIKEITPKTKSSSSDVESVELAGSMTWVKELDSSAPTMRVEMDGSDELHELDGGFGRREGSGVGDKESSAASVRNFPTVENYSPLVRHELAA